MSTQILSVIIPSYNEAANIERTYEALKSGLKEIPFEVFFVDDGSKDGTYEIVEKLHETHPEVKGISFSRNYGKEAAIFAGLEAATGDCAVLMDCDLQHPVEVIPQMYQLWKEGYEVVEGVKASRGKEGIFHKICAKLFYRYISKATGIDMSRASDFKLLDRKAIDALLILPERAPFFRALSSWIGFKSTSVAFEVKDRELGSSKWSFKSLARYAIHNITSFSGAPLQLVTFLGWVMFLFTVILGIQTLYRYFSGTAMEGFTTVILLLLFIGSVLMLSLGIIGHYISRIYDEIKARPRYIVRKRC